MAFDLLQTAEHYSGKSTRLDKAISLGMIAAIVFTALAHGAVEAWSVAVFEAIVLTLILLWAVKAVIERRASIIMPRAALPIIAFTVVGLVQSAVLENEAGRWGLSMDAEATRAAALTLFFLLASFLICANFFAGRERLRALANFLVIYGMAMALFALAQHFTWNGHLYWLRPNTQGGTPFGPFVNRNHFAGYMEMLTSLAVGLVVTRGVRGEARLFYGFAATVMGLAVVASLSRGGMIALTASMIFIAVMKAVRKDEGEMARGRGSAGLKFFSFRVPPYAFVSVIVAAIIAGVVWIGLDPVVNRIAETGVINSGSKQQALLTGREQIWRDTLAMIQARPLLGVGLGAYETAYPVYSRGDGSLVIAQAHNDYLQALADCGIVGGVIVLVFLALTLRSISRGIKSRDPLLAGLALGSGGGIFAMLIHSIFDFNLQLPSNALLFLVLSAAASHIGEVAAEPGSVARFKAGSRQALKEAEMPPRAAPVLVRGIQS